MMPHKLFSLLGLMVILLSACSTTQKGVEKTIFIAATTQPCSAGAMETQCMQVKWTKEQKDWEFFYGSIDGFNYEKGYEYELIVQEEKIDQPAVDASTVKYTLIKQVAKHKIEELPLVAKPYTSTHVFTAQFQGVKFHTCLGRTSACPQHCGSSGNMANFKVLDYSTFLVNGQGGTEKLTDYSVLISDYYKKELTAPYVATIKHLKVGDVVTIHVDYVYDTTQSTVATVENIISITPKEQTSDGHSAQNSLDWAGTYEGVFPCADCEGIKTVVTLMSDNTFRLSTTYLKGKKSQSYEEKGKLEWQSSGNTLALLTSEKQLYKVEENRLVALDTEGKPMTGELAEHYILKKQRSVAQTSTQQLEDTRWQLVSFRGKEIKTSAESHYLIFHSQNHSAETKVGCNMIQFGYSILNETGIQFKPGLSTLMACPNDSIETDYVAKLETVNGFSVVENTLTLRSGKTIIAVYKRVN